MCIDPQLKIVLKTLLFTDFCLNLKCPVYIRKKLSKNASFFLIRDLWWAVCQRGRAWAAVRPHSSCIHCHPWITTRWRHTEQVRHKWAFVHVNHVLLDAIVITLCYFCVLQEELHYLCLLSTTWCAQAHDTKCEWQLQLGPYVFGQWDFFFDSFSSLHQRSGF